MQKRFFMFLSSAALLVAMESSLKADDNKIQTFVNSKGKLVFTNLSDRPSPTTASVSTQAPAIVRDDLDPLAIKMPPTLKTLVDSISTNHGVDPALVRAVMKTESNFNRWAVSNKGAMGLMQLIPATGRRFGVSDFYDPQQNIEGGVRYLKFLLQKFDGNVDLALAGYNAGENLVARLGRIPAIKETTNYVKKIRAMYPRPFVEPPASLALAAATGSNSAPLQENIVSKETPKQASETAVEVPQRIYRTVDSRGVVRFSNLGPPN
jgi:hypothetical protein